MIFVVNYILCIHIPIYIYNVFIIYFEYYSCIISIMYYEYSQNLRWFF